MLIASVCNNLFTLELILFVKENSVKVGEIRQWLKPRGYTGEFHRFMVIDVNYSSWSGETSCNIMYPNGHIQDLWVSDLFKDPEDPEDDEYSVCIEEVANETQDGENQNRFLQG